MGGLLFATECIIVATQRNKMVRHRALAKGCILLVGTYSVFLGLLIASSNLNACQKFSIWISKESTSSQLLSMLCASSKRIIEFYKFSYRERLMCAVSR